MYGQLLPYVNHRADLNYLLDMMGAEIAIGHSFVRGGDMPEVPRSACGSARRRLRDRERALQDHARSTGPRAGTRICARRSRRRASTCTSATTSSRSTGWSSRARQHLPLLDGTANQQTVLTVNARPSTEGARQVTVVPIANERGCARARGSSATVTSSTRCRTASSRMYICRTRRSLATRASTATTSRSRIARARSSTSATTAAARRRTTSSTCCSATSTATSTIRSVPGIRSRVLRRGSGGRR